MKNLIVKIGLTLAVITFLISNVFPANNRIELSKYNIVELKALAKKAERNKDLTMAISCYNEINKKKSSSEIVFKLAQLHEEINEYYIAADYYKTSAMSNDRKSTALFHYARMQKILGNAEEAMKNFKKFLRFYRGKEIKKYRILTLNEIKGCKNAIKKPSVNEKIEIITLDQEINSTDIEFSPLILNDTTIYFGSGSGNVEGDTYRGLYSASKKNNKWLSTDEVLNELQIEREIANASLSPDGKILFVTLLKKNVKGEELSEIYMSKKQDGVWGELIKLNKNINALGSNNTQPAIAFSLKTNEVVLYFASNRKKGFGGFDIWYSIFDAEKNEFGKAKNLGNRINSPGDEITPFYDNENRVLYYSSDGLPGYGGYDIFKSLGEKNYWRKVQNIGLPVNSNLDEIYYSTNSYNDGGFFVSNRIEVEGAFIPNCCDDIFAYKDNAKVNVEVKGEIFRETLSANSNIIPDFMDKAIGETKINLYKIDEQGELLIKTKGIEGNLYTLENLEPDQEYKMIVANKHFYNQDIYFKTPVLEHSETIELNPIELALLPEQSIELKNIYYEYDEYKLTKNSLEYIDTTLYNIMDRNKELKIELLAHTDNKGSAKYNKELSQKRAESVVNYLISKGVESNRIIAMGMGEEYPKFTNETDEGRKMNRRVEFKVLVASCVGEFADNK